MPFDGATSPPDWTYRLFPNGQSLKPNQRVAADFLSHGRFRMLAMKPRLGKTYSSLAAANAMLQDFGGNVVVVCPAGLRSSWRSKIDELREGTWRAHVVSYNDVAAGKIVGLPLAIDVLILDESHYLKSRDSQRTIAVLGPECDGKGGLAERAKFVWCLSGTPVPNSPTELWSLLRCFAPDVIKSVTGRPMCFGDFQDHYCVAVNTLMGRKIVGGRRLPKLKAVMTPFTLVQDYSVLPDVPDPPIPEVVYVEVARADAKAIRELEYSKEGRAFRDALANNGVSGLQKLGTHAATLRRLLAIAKVPAVADLVTEYLNNDPDLKIVVFGHHVEAMTALRKRLARFGALGWTGGMTTAQQDSIKRRFNKDPKCRVLCAGIEAASEGHDFSIADMSIRAECSWVPGKNEQADMRTWNLEKRRPTSVKIAVLKGTVDEVVMRALSSKSRMSKAIFS